MADEDYLEVDKPLPGQNYVCMSFISPENTYKQKGKNNHPNIYYLVNILF